MPNTKKATGSGLRQYGLELRCTENSTDITNNTSSISWSLVLTSGAYSFSDFWAGWTVKLGDTTVSHRDDNYMALSIGANTEKVIVSGTNTVVHNNDGSKTIDIYGYLSISSAYPGPGDITCSTSWALTTIPRASTLTIPTLTIGSAATLTVTAASNTFTHKITYSFSGLTGDIGTLNAGVATTSWTPPSSLYNKLPNATQGTISITLKTYSNATEIGSNTYNATVNVGTSIKPTAPTVTLEPVNDNAWFSSQNLYVGGYTKVKVTSSASPGTGASISLYSISGAFSGSGTPFTSNALSAGSKTIVIRATDSRGRSNDTTKTLTFLAYTLPGFSTLSAERGTYLNGSWTSDVNGDHIKVTAVPVYALSNEGNTGTVTVKIGASDPDVTSGNTYYFTSTNASTSYSITVTNTDLPGFITTRTLTVSTVEVPLNVDVDIPGVAVGMVSQTPQTFEVAPSWKVQFDGQVIGNGKYNYFQYMPFSWEVTGTLGTSGYVRIATITITGTYADETISFRVYRRKTTTACELYVRFASENNTDPAIGAFYYDSGGLSCNCYVNREGTGQWGVYIQKYDASDYVAVEAHVPPFMQWRCTVIKDDGQSSSIPSGATRGTPRRGTGSITPATGVTTVSSRVREFSGFVSVLWTGKVSTAFTSGTYATIGTISGVTKPPIDYGGYCVTGTQAVSLSTHSAQAIMKPDGSIVVSPGTSGDTYFTINVIYATV